MAVNYVKRIQIFFVLNQQEGWNLFDTRGGEDGQIQIQWIDEDRIIETRGDDTGAIEFVLAKALEGSERHQWALGQVKKYNPNEWNRVIDIAYKFGVEFGQEDQIPTRDLGFNFF